MNISIANFSQRNSNYKFMPNHGVSFGNLESNLKIAKTAISEFHRDFGYPHSESFLSLQIFKHKKDSNYKDIIKNLKPVLKKYTKEVKSVIYKYYSEPMLPNVKIKKRYMEDCVKEFGAANCDQDLEIINCRLRGQGIKTR